MPLLGKGHLLRHGSGCLGLTTKFAYNLNELGNVYMPMSELILCGCRGEAVCVCVSLCVHRGRDVVSLVVNGLRVFQ